jgi:hypothetical protein
MSARARVHARADANFTASAGKCGCGRTSGRTFSSKNVRYDIPELSDKLNGERGRRQPWIAPYQQLNAKFQSLQMNETCYVISNMEIQDTYIKKNEA